MDIDFTKSNIITTKTCIYLAHPELPLHRIRLSGIDEVVVDEVKPDQYPKDFSYMHDQVMAQLGNNET